MSARNSMPRVFLCVWAANTALASVVTNYEYNQAGDVTKTWVADGSSTLSRTDAEYDVLGRQIRVTQAMELAGANIQKGIVTHQDYDVAGNLTARRVETGTSGVYMTTVYVYDDLGRQVTAKGPSTSVDSTYAPRAIYEYDASGNATRQLVRASSTGDYAIARLEYDALNRPTKVFAKSDSSSEQVHESAYDSHGRVLREYVYVSTNQVGGPYLQQTRTEYDHAGRVVRRIRMADATNTGEYFKEVDNVLEYNYDRDGRTIGEVTYDWGYPARPLVIQPQYDGLGRLTKRIDPKGYYDQMDYDSRGFVVTQTRWDGQEHRTLMDYDNRGRLIQSIAKGTADLTTLYAYDGIGRRTLVTDPSNKQTYNEYDLIGHVTKMIEDYGGLDRQTDYVYDQQGRLWQQIAHNNDAQHPTQTTVYGYDVNGNQATVTYPDSGVLAFEFYPNGAVSRRTDQAGIVLTYVYDLRGLLLTKSNPADASYLVRYDYDGAGRMVTAKMGPDGQNGHPESQIVYTYDGLNRLVNEQQTTSATQPAPREVLSEYDQTGNRTRLAYPQQ